MKKHSSVIIIGAGLSGLRAASLLCAKGISCRVLEARERIGGRVLSQEVEGRPELGAFDLGPTWFWPQYEPAITELVADLGLKRFVQYNKGFILSERSLHESPQRFKLPEGGMESFMRLEGGVQTLIDAIAATLPKGTIQLNSRVTTICQEVDGSLAIEVNEGKENIIASAIIMAIPPRMAARKIIFKPDLSSDLMMGLLNKPTWMAAHAKAVAIYERPFWREDGLSGFATSWVGPLQEIHDASPISGAGALFGFFGMPVKDRDELGKKTILKLVMEQLVRLFGPLAENKVAVLYKDWSNDRETAVVEDLEPLRDYPNYGPLREMKSWDKKIFFAGTETSRVQGGHLEGALQSADRAVYELLSHKIPGTFP